jgi:integrase
MHPAAIAISRLKHHGRRIVVRERYQRPEVKDLGTKWKLHYWDYSLQPRRKRSKVWAKSKVPSEKDAQRRGDDFMAKVNARNNEPHLFPSLDETLASLIAKCREKTWPHLKKSTVKQYEMFMTTYLLPEFGTTKLRKMNTIDLQDFFNTFTDRLSAKTIQLMRGCLRAQLNQAIAWSMLDKNPAEKIKLPRKKAVKPPVVLALWAIRKLIEALPEPTRSVVTLIVFGSMRVGEVLALRWRSIFKSAIHVDERLYDGEFDDVKTDAGNRYIPFDSRGLIDGALNRAWNRSKFHKPDDLVFCTKDGKPLERRNLLRHLKKAARDLGLPKTLDFRSFRTMHSSLMRREGVRLEVVRDNMGHSEIATTANIYSKSWLDERTDAVTRVVDAVMSAEKKEEENGAENASKRDFNDVGDSNGYPFWVPQLNS